MHVAKIKAECVKYLIDDAGALNKTKNNCIIDSVIFLLESFLKNILQPHLDPMVQVKKQIELNQ